jgi:hypothetical protein
MPTDPERRSICYPNRGFPAQTACRSPQVSCIAPVTWRVPMPNLGPEVRRSGRRLIRIFMSLTAFTLAWLGASTSYLPPDSQREEPTAVSTVDAVVERIIDVESGGVARELWLSCQQWRTPTPPSLWPLPTQRVGPSEKNSLTRIPSSNASRSLILGTGRTAKCALLVYSCSAGKPGGGYCSPWSPGSVGNVRI